MTPPAPQQLSVALRELAKLVKAVQYYPSGHPAVETLVESTHAAFTPLLAQQENLSCEIHREGFVYDKKPFGKENPALQKLAPFLFARRMKHLLLLPDLSPRDLLAFARTISLEVKEILRQGGIKEALLKARVTTIWANETDLQQILQQRDQLETEIAQGVGDEDLGPVELQEQEQIRTLETVIAELKTTLNNQEFQQRLQELNQLLPLAKNDEQRLLLIEGLALLCRFISSKKLPMERRELANQILTQVADRDMIDFLIDLLCLRQLNQRLREVLQNILVMLRDRAISRLMERLIEENDASRRKFLVTAMVRQGKEALPVLAEFLNDERWFVVRNAVAIIGDIRDPEGATYLGSFLHHEDLRVCREVIRALAKTGGEDSLRLLLQMVEDDNEELSRQALLSLGALKDPAALPVLMRIVRQSDPWLKRTVRQRDAIRAIGEIGHPDAVRLLLWVLKRRRWFRGRHYVEVRAAAAQALGEIGDPAAARILEKATNDRNAQVARQANLALKQLQRAENHAE